MHLPRAFRDVDQGGDDRRRPRGAPPAPPKSKRVHAARLSLAHASGLRCAFGVGRDGDRPFSASTSLPRPCSSPRDATRGSSPRRVPDVSRRHLLLAILPGLLSSLTQRLRRGRHVLRPRGPLARVLPAGANVVSASAPSRPAGVPPRARLGASCMAVSASGRLMATGRCGVNADVCVWDLTTGELKFRLSEHDEGIAAVAFPDERLLVSCGIEPDGKIFAWDAETGCIVANGMCAPADCKGGVLPDRQGRAHTLRPRARTSSLGRRRRQGVDRRAKVRRRAHQASVLQRRLQPRRRVRLRGVHVRRRRHVHRERVRPQDHRAVLQGRGAGHRQGRRRRVERG